MKPLMVDLYAGLGGWAEGGLVEGYFVVGFDIERHEYGEHRYPGQLVIQDVLTLHGSQFKDAALIVASPPCQRYSWMAMPWSKAKAAAVAIRADESGRMLADLTRLFDACFRIQAQASLAAGRHIPMVVENVRGAIPWVGRSRWNFGSYHLWGDVPALMPMTANRLKGGQTNWRDHGKPGYRGDQLQDHFKSVGMNWSDRTKHGQDFTRVAGRQAIEGTKDNGGSWFAIGSPGQKMTGQNPDGRKVPGGGAEGWFGSNDHPLRQHSSGDARRKAASAMIAKIPFPLARHVAAVYRP
jgi:hypothetical protein